VGEPQGSEPMHREPYRPSRGFLVSLAVVYAIGGMVILPRAGGDDAAPRAVPVRPALHRPAPDSAALEREALIRYAHAPLAAVLRPRTGDGAMANRIAEALVSEARRLRLAPSLLAALLLTENARLDLDTVSSRGATGLMQVMPFHAGEYGCASDDLTDVEGNICHGARVLGHYLKRTGTVPAALLRYNGCGPRATDRSCDAYPTRVLATAGRVRHQLIQYAAARARADSAARLAIQ
jgi:soluble lytic murein transglycosylase-like protein